MENAERFFRMIARTTEDENGCLLWTGAKSTTGYARIRVEGALRQASGVIYEEYHGEIPKGMLVCHKCDNRLCINPDHLFLGTPSDNIKDCVAKGRHARAGGSGPGSNYSKLTEGQVLFIRAERRAGRTNQSLADELGVVEAAVRLAAEGKRWPHLPGALTKEEMAATSRKGKNTIGTANPNAKVNPEIVLEIRAAYDRGDKIRPMAAKFGITESTASSIARRLTWRHI